LAQHRGDLVLRAAIEPAERLPSRGGQAQTILATVLGRGLADDQALVLEILDDAAEIARIQPQFGSDRLRCRIVAVRKLIQYPRLRERERAAEQVLLEHAEPFCVEPVEGPHRGDQIVGNRFGHRAPQYLPLSNKCLTLASICRADLYDHDPAA
jgi:hypothetical protein